jgi:3-oxoacyl-[acyl-carrier-protein] synthase I
MNRLRILGAGAATPIGLTAASTAAAFRAGVVRFRALDNVGTLRASYLDALPWGLASTERTVGLTSHALSDLLRTKTLNASTELRAWIGLSESEPQGPAVEHALRDYLRAALPWLVESTVIRGGRAAFFAALAAANRSLLAHDCDVALVGAADSLCAPEWMQTLAHERRLLGPETEGLIPGEGAAFLLLARQDFAGSRGSARPTLLACATAQEHHHRRQTAPNAAEALTAVFRALRTAPATQGRRADMFLTCETGEPFWTEEVAMAYLRNTALMPEPFRRTMAAEALGDLGAAAGAVMTAIGLQWIARPATQGPRQDTRLLLVAGSSDGGLVGGCLIEAATWEER